jgi:rubredoxin
MRFEGSVLNVQPEDRLECGICWWVYDPASGDDVRGISAWHRLRPICRKTGAAPDAMRPNTNSWFLGE